MCIQDFRRFRDSVLPQILNNSEVNATYFESILEENDININLLPHRIWCVKCSLVPNCHRNYCSFYHDSKQKQYGRIIQLLTNQQSNNRQLRKTNEQQFHQKGNQTLAMDGSVLSRHTLLIQGMSTNTKAKKVEETFNVYGEISSVTTDADQHVFYVRMKRNLDARKIVYLYQFDQSGMKVSFACVNGAKQKHKKKDKKKRKRVSKEICEPRLMLSAIHYSHCPQPSSSKLKDNRPLLVHSNSQKASTAIMPLHKKVECTVIDDDCPPPQIKKIHEYDEHTHQSPQNDTRHYVYNNQRARPMCNVNNNHYQCQPQMNYYRQSSVVNHQIFHQQPMQTQQRISNYNEYRYAAQPLPSVPQQSYMYPSVSNSASVVNPSIIDSHSVSMMKSNTTTAYYGYPTYTPKYSSPMHSVPHQPICSSPANTPFEEEFFRMQPTQTYIKPSASVANHFIPVHGQMFISNPPPPPPRFYQMQQRTPVDECAYAAVAASVIANGGPVFDSELQFTIGDQRMNSSANVSAIEYVDNQYNMHNNHLR